MTFPIEPKRFERETPSSLARYQYPWMPYPAGVDAIKRMTALMKRPHEGRPLNLAIIGDPNFGKSHLIDFFVDHYPDLPDEENPRIQILSIEMPPKADGAALMRELLRVMGAAVNPKLPLDVLLDKFCVRAQSLRILLFLIDEFHNGAWGRREAAMTLIHAVRAISNRLRRPIVIAGTSVVNEVLRNDPQLEERFTKLTMPNWSELKHLKDLLATFETNLDLPEPSGLGTDEMARYVLGLTGPKLGRISVCVREAHRIALQKGASRIETIHLDEAKDLLPGNP